MKEMTKQSVRDLTQSVMDSLLHLEIKHGIKFTYKGGRYDPSNVTFKIEAAIVAKNGQVLDRDSQEFTLSAETYGMKASWLNKEFTHWGDKYKVVGLRTRAWKAPVIVERADGKRFKMRSEMIVDAFKSNKN